MKHKLRVFGRVVEGIVPAICTQETAMGQNKILLQISNVHLAQLLLGLALQNLPQALFSWLPWSQFTSKGNLGLGLRKLMRN